MMNSWRCLTCPSPLSSISLDDMPAPGPPDPSISPVSVLHNSPFYSPVREVREVREVRDVRNSPSQGAASTFSTFHPQVRTSPEGSSCGDTDQEQQARGQ